MTATGGTDNAKIITYLHSGVTLQHRAGTGEVRRAGRERERGGVHLPVAERAPVQPGPPGQRDRLGDDHQPQAELDQLTPRWHGRSTRLIVDGILVGGVYALMAVGLTLIFGVLDIINIAQGILVILGAYLSYELSVHLHIDLFLGLLITVPGHVRDRRRHPVGVHPAAARPGADLDDAAGHLRGRADHRGDPLRDLRAQPRAAERLVRQSSVHVFGFYLPYIYLYGFALALVLVAAHLPAAVPDHVRPQRAGHDAGPDRGAARRHRR